MNRFLKFLLHIPKHIFFQFLNDLMSPTMDETKGQPTLMSIQTACLHFGGPLLTCRAFKQCGPRPLRGIANSEFTEAVNALEQAGLGKVRSVQVRFAPHPVQVFIKQKPENVNWPSDLCSQNDYRSKYNQNANKCISTAIKRALIDANFIPQEMFPDV